MKNKKLQMPYTLSKNSIPLSLLIMLFLFSGMNLKIHAQNATFTWKAGTDSKNFTILAPENHSYTVNWGDESAPQVYTSTGRYQPKADIAYTYAKEGIYTVTVTANEGSIILSLEVQSNAIQTLTAKGVRSLACHNNELTHLDVTECDGLISLQCSNNQLSTLDLSKNRTLVLLGCNKNKLTTLDLSVGVTLSILNCRNNQLTDLKLGSPNAIQTVFCDSNKLQTLDVSKNIKIKQLSCKLNQLEILDISHNKELTELEISNNLFTNIDISENTKLKLLFCENNLLADLDITKNTDLEGISCYGNVLPLSILYAISEKIAEKENKKLGTQTLPNQEVYINKEIEITSDVLLGGKETAFTVKKDNGSAVENTDYTLTDGKITFHTSGIYTVETTHEAIISSNDHPAKIIQNFYASADEPLEEGTILFTSRGSKQEISFLIFAPEGDSFSVDWGDESDDEVFTSQLIVDDAAAALPAHTYADENIYTVTVTSLNGAAITALDFQSGSPLQTLQCKSATVSEIWCQNNELTMLDITGCPNLTTLFCYENKLSILNLSRNTKLEVLLCYENELTALDIIRNKALELLECHNNKLTGLDVSQNTSLEKVICSENALTLGILYNISQHISQPVYKTFGTQKLPLQNASLNEPAIVTPDLILGESTTQFKVKKGANNAVENTDYTLNEGAITFKTSGTFNVEMTNAAIVSNGNCIVIAPFNVTDDFSMENVTVGDIQNVTYTGEEFEPKPEIKYNGIMLTEGTDYNLAYENNINAGKATIIITGKGTYNGTKTVYFTIDKASQIITFAQLDEAELNEGTIRLNASASSTLKVTYESSDEETASVSDEEITLYKTGEIGITASQAGNENYLAAPDVIRTLKIVDSSTSVPVAESGLWTVYPNPATDYVYIGYLINQNTTLIIHSMDGTIMDQVVLDSELNTIRLETSRYPAGMYMYTLGEKTSRFIIK